mmetsp:Transcript_26602/g.82262  ORF Transcript_26602/g.82262 Transcript_26602/m.82262 type:complete len:206 (-) Transcript_26602:1419-2036(-)
MTNVAMTYETSATCTSLWLSGRPSRLVASFFEPGPPPWLGFRWPLPLVLLRLPADEPRLAASSSTGGAPAGDAWGVDATIFVEDRFLCIGVGPIPEFETTSSMRSISFCSCACAMDANDAPIFAATVVLLGAALRPAVIDCELSVRRNEPPDSMRCSCRRVASSAGDPSPPKLTPLNRRDRRFVVGCTVVGELPCPGCGGCWKFP